MKHLPITSPHYKYILQSFKEWLDVLGYAETTVYSMPHYIRELLHYIEQNGKHQITDIENKIIKEYYRELKQRGNTRQGGGLSNSYLNKHLQAIQKFSDYLRQSGRLQLPKLYIPTEDDQHEIKDILTQEEIQQLYKATELYPSDTERIAPWMYEALAKRDRAMLTILYGCGLRRTEAVSLDIRDIQTDKGYIYVKKGKNYKERFVPINAKDYSIYKIISTKAAHTLPKTISKKCFCKSARQTHQRTKFITASEIISAANKQHRITTKRNRIAHITALHRHAPITKRNEVRSDCQIFRA